MKYCTKCGNPMEDDMMFCQKCGTKFEEIKVKAEESIQEKLVRMKNYNLVLDAKSITWEYLNLDKKRAGNICLKQDELCAELVDLIKDILSTVTEDERTVVEREVYTFVLQMGIKMCQESKKMFANYTGFRGVFERGKYLVEIKQLDVPAFLDQMIQEDYVYKTVAGLQCLHSTKIKDTLDESVIYNNNEYKALTKELAQSFNDMWKSCIKRYVDFMLSPGEPYININWDNYCIILKGLPISIIDSLDESGWKIALDDWEENHHGRQYKQDFIRKRDNDRDKRRRKEEEDTERTYWESHPNEFIKFEENKRRISEVLQQINETNNQLRLLEKDKYLLAKKKTDIENGIAEYKPKIEKLEKIIFGKKKAEQEIQILNEEIMKANQELQDVEEKMKITEKQISDKKTEQINLDREIRDLGEENQLLRSK